MDIKITSVISSIVTTLFVPVILPLVSGDNSRHQLSQATSPVLGGFGLCGVIRQEGVQGVSGLHTVTVVDAELGCV